jgi:conjugative relaxase-like TrwC/TraI family protein
VSVSWTKLKLPAPAKGKESKERPKGELSAEDIVAYVMDVQSGGDYYSEAGHAKMMWHTTEWAAVQLGIAQAGQRPSQQEVRRETLARLLEGRHPVTGEPFRRIGSDGTRVAALDLTVSPAPKSVSILWALASNERRRELELMVAQAADRAVMRMLRERPFVRRRIDGEVQHVRAKDYVVASALHTTARMSAQGREAPDPQLHLHYLLIGALDEKGQLRALDSKVLADYRAELDAEASGHLAEMLRQRGFEIERRLEYGTNKNGIEVPRVYWEVAGVPESLIEAMSSRSMEIAALKAKFMKETGLEPVGPRWDKWIVMQRGPKGKLTSLELRLAWIEEARRHGYGPEAVDLLFSGADLRRERGVPDRDADSQEAEQLRALVMDHVCSQFAFVDEDYLNALARQLAKGLIPETEVDAVLIRMIEDYDLVMTKPDRRVTALEILRWEKRALAGARRLMELPWQPAAAHDLVEAELARQEAEGRPFDEYQATAVRLAVSGARFVSISGPAGTGKGLAANSIAGLVHRSAWRVLESAGRRVIALAVAGQRAQETGAESDADDAMTLDALEVRLGDGRERLVEGDVLLVDEGGVIEHPRYAALLEAAAAAGVTVIQIGDDKQLPSVGPGGLWTSTHQLAASVGTSADLRVVRRTMDPQEAEAWTDVREGRVVKGLTYIRDAGRLRLYHNREQLREAMVAAWWEGGPDRGLMMVDTSNEERDVLNSMAQEKRLEAGEIHAEAVRLDDRRELHVGDRVLFTRSTDRRGPRPSRGAGRGGWRTGRRPWSGRSTSSVGRWSWSSRSR